MDCRALVVLAGSPADPHLLPFVGGARLGGAMVIVPRDRPAHLAYLTPMERGEAAASGLALLSPEQLDVARWAREGAEPADLWQGVLERALQLCGVAPGRLAIAGHANAGLAVALAGQLSRDGWQLIDGSTLVARQARTKSEGDRDEIARVAHGTAEAFRQVASLLASAVTTAGGLTVGGRPLTVGRVRRHIARVLAAHGLEQPEGNIVAPAEEGAVPHNTGDDARLLEPHTSLIVDVFPRGRLFADCTRTFCIGAPPPALAAAHRLVEEALVRAHRGAVAGARGFDLQRAVCDHLSAAGHATPLTDPGTVVGYVHGLGHGVGYALHELPSFRDHAGVDGILRAGDVFTLEPGLYHPEEGWAVRLEDTVALTGDGPVNLTPLPRALDPSAW